MATKVENVHIGSTIGEGWLSLSCEIKGDAYHVWINDEKELRDSTLYKNVPKPTPRDPAATSTRYLVTTSKTGRAILEGMLAEWGPALKAWKKKEAAERILEEANRLAAERKAKAEAAGPELLELLDQIAKIAFKHEVQYWKDEPGTDEEKLARILSIARDGIAKGRGL